MADSSSDLDLPKEVLVKVFSSCAHPNSDSVRNLCAAASVCPSWRLAAAEPSLWRELCVDEAPLSGRLTEARLRSLVARSHSTLTRLVLRGCPRVTDAMLACAVQQQPRLVDLCVTGCALVTRRRLAHALCDCEDVQGVVAQLNDPQQSAADAQRCCVALCTLLEAEGWEEPRTLTPPPPLEYDDDEEPSALAQAQAAGTLDALLRCAARHAAHPGVQAACCFALSLYVHGAQDSAVASYPPIFQAVVAALKAHPSDVHVQGPALLTLCNVCCSGLLATPGVPALLDAIQPVLAALRAFPADLGVQEYGCDSLTNMCKLDASVAAAVAAAGAMGLFIKALHLDITCDTTRVSAIDAIGAIALCPAALPQASACIDAVMRTMRHHEGGDVAEAACKTLGIFLRSSVTHERAVQAGAEAAVQAGARAAQDVAPSMRSDEDSDDD